MAFVGHEQFRLTTIKEHVTVGSNEFQLMTAFPGSVRYVDHDWVGHPYTALCPMATDLMHAMTVTALQGSVNVNPVGVDLSRTGQSQIPFRFTLPSNLPASFVYSAESTQYGSS